MFYLLQVYVLVIGLIFVPVGLLYTVVALSRRTAVALRDLRRASKPAFIRAAALPKHTWSLMHR